MSRETFSAKLSGTKKGEKHLAKDLTDLQSPN
jgi:hypothetical protein